MNVTFKKFKQLDFVGYEMNTLFKDDQHFKDIPAFWQECYKNGKCQTLFDIMLEDSCIGVAGVMYNYSDEGFTYMIGVEGENIIKDTVHKRFVDLEYACFEIKGKLPESIQTTLPVIFKEWLPNSEFTHSGGPELEVYSKGDTTSDEYVCYYYVPIMKK